MQPSHPPNLSDISASRWHSNADAAQSTEVAKKVMLVGLGVVGRAILKAHIDSGVSISIHDTDASRVEHAVDELNLNPNDWCVGPSKFVVGSGAELKHKDSQRQADDKDSVLVIESIAERLDIKRSFFGELERRMDKNAIYCSNTSTLKIRDISCDLADPSRLCGMHFFMPVSDRDAVEIVRAPQSSEHAIQAAVSHAKRLGKIPLPVNDHPGFIVNRLLSPYLNQALLLLAHGVHESTIETAASEYGMPLSPLELIDWIGLRTTFDAGHSFCKAFPNRMDPSPIIARMLKIKRFGRSDDRGFYDYQHNKQRSKTLASQTKEIVQRYSLQRLELNEDQVMLLLCVPMYIEACIAYQEGVFSSVSDLDTAMSGGLGFLPETGWIEFFRQLGIDRIRNSAVEWSDQFRSMQVPRNTDISELVR